MNHIISPGSENRSLTPGTQSQGLVKPTIEEQTSQKPSAVDVSDLSVTSAFGQSHVIPHDFARIMIHAHSSPKIQRDLVGSHNDNTEEKPADKTQLLAKAAAESASPLDPLVQAQLSRQVGHDFSKVRVHHGPASAQAADYLGARAYTLGNSIHMGTEGLNLGKVAQTKLLAHEAIHTVQQGAVSVTPHSGIAVSSPSDAAEIEAQQIAASIEQVKTPPPSGSLALRDRLRRDNGKQTVSRRVQPQLQRDLKGKHTVKDGTFDLNLKTESHPGAKNGMSGTIKFTASGTSPDSKNIRILQIAKLVDSSTGKDYVWTGGEANRNKAMTTADKSTGVEGGFFVDVLHAGRTPRTSKANPSVSPYYIDDYGTGGGNQDGSKAGKTIKEASIWDYPGWSSNSRFSFETAAKAADTGYVYATLSWGFTISDAAKGKVTAEHASASLVPSSTFGAAVKAFDEFYKNPGSSKAP